MRTHDRFQVVLLEAGPNGIDPHSSLATCYTVTLRVKIRWKSINFTVITRTYVKERGDLPPRLRLLRVRDAVLQVVRKRVGIAAERLLQHLLTRPWDCSI